MNKLQVTAASVAAAMFAGTSWLYARADGTKAPAYRTAPITRATLTSTVSATGALNAVRTVQVGTQVSGQVAQLFVDFNDKVKKGQLLARIDPRLQEQAVQDAEAQLDRAKAQLSLAHDEYERNKQLYDARVITASEFATTQSNLAVEEATVKSAQIALDRAKQNLAYTQIYAPIDGVIVERNVDVGQTVAASLSAPQLFLIANDLSEMRILASVDESDIGLIKTGSRATFTVQSYPNEHFQGTVEQVRLQSTTLDNVVSYTAVVRVKNPTGRLLPGMTATVEFVTGEADNVLTVPNAALRIRPTEAMVAEAGVAPARDSSARDSSGRARPAAAVARGPAVEAGARDGGGRGGRRGRPAGGEAQRTTASLWYLDAAGKLHTAVVRVGRTDGQRTQISGKGIEEGTRVVTTIMDVGEGAAAGGSATSNPFQSGRRGPRGF